MSRVFKISVIFFLISFFYGHASAESSEKEIPLSFEKHSFCFKSNLFYLRIKRPKIILVLSGGGSRGIAQIGVLKALEKRCLPVDVIVGTSMGALVGGLYSLGYSPDTLESIVKSVDWNSLIEDAPTREELFVGQKEEQANYLFQFRLKHLSIEIPSSFAAGQRLFNMLADLVYGSPYAAQKDFTCFPVQFYAVATDLLSGSKLVLSKGSIISAMQGSMAIPLLLAPVQLDSMLLVDGGLVSNLPVEEGRKRGDLVIAVDTSSKLRDKSRIKAPWEVVDQVTTIMQKQAVEKSLASADISIIPDLSERSNTDFTGLDSLIRTGEEAALRITDQIEAKILSFDTSYAGSEKYFIKKISIKGLKLLKEPDLISSLPVNVPDTLTEADINWLANQLIQTEKVLNISAKVDTAEGMLNFYVRESPFVKSFEFYGNTVFPDSVLKAVIDFKKQGICNVKAMFSSFDKILNLYASRGFSLVKIDSVKYKGGVISVYVNEGRVKRILIRGNKNTRDFVIKREISIKPGDLFSRDKILQSVESIYSTGLFKSVKFDVSSEGNGYNLYFYLKEKAYSVIRIGLRYDIERQTKGFFQIVRENLLGIGDKASVRVLTGRRDESIQGKIWADRLFKTYFTYSVSFIKEAHHRDFYSDLMHVGSYKNRSARFSVSAGHQMQKLGKVSISLNNEHVNITTSGDSGSVPSGKYDLRFFKFRSEVDTRDRVPFTTKGKFHVLEYETAGTLFGSGISYVRLYSSTESYYKAGTRFTIHPKIAWGAADRTIPFSKEFFIGGMNSFMGLPLYAMHGKRFISVNSEIRYRFPVKNEVYLFFRYDVAGVWNTYSKIEGKDFLHGLGISLAAASPLGPLFIGFGKAGTHQRFYVSLGHAF